MELESGEDFGPWLARQLRLLNISQAELGSALA